MRKKICKQIIAVCCALAMFVTGLPATDISVKAASGDFFDENNSVMIDKGGYKTEVFGVRTDDWGQTWTDRKESLPTSKVYLTDNYKEAVGTVPTNDWASSVVFDQYSESLYAHPLAYRAASNGMQMASPAVVDSTSYVDGEPTVESLLEDDTVELVVGGENFKAKDAEVDKTTDWSYEIVMANSAGSSSMRAIIAKGTPYAYYTFNNIKPTISLGAGATNLAINRNSTSSNIIGVSLTNKKDGKSHYYMLSAPSGTTWTNANGKLTANMPSGKNYLSVAILPDNSDDAFSLYEKYAFNFITDTKVQWEYLNNSSKVITKYNVTTKNMETGDEGGDTIIALYPHQWRYSQSEFTKYTYSTIRGTMKTIVGTNYVTQMQYNGILSTLPVTTNQDTIDQIKEQLGYLYYYRKTKDDPKWICYLEGQYGGYDTYWIGKNLNTMADAIWLSGQLDSDDADMKTITNDMVEGIENYLEFWFDPYQAYISGNYQDDYFYYDKDYGTLIGYPSSYDSDKQMNDHHFHYGYWIKAAAAVAMKDPQWAEEWSGMVYEMIGDIANVNRDGKGYNENSATRYPFLRNFDIYEGHSWASGVANYEYDENGELVDKKGGLAGGNNQESSSEAVNAWASLILWGEAVGNTQIRDAGIYMYTTEIAAIEDYYYDVHNEIFTEKYKDRDNYNIQTVTRLFGGRYDHTAWWTENSIEVTTITMLPISGATLYLGKYKDKVKNVVDSIDENSNQWKHFVVNKEQICKNFNKVDMLTDPKTNQDVIAEYYAYYDPDEALKRWDKSDNGKVENGESRAHTLSYITTLQNYGNQDFTITGSEPLSLVFNKDGQKTYVAENHTDKAKRVYFTDNTYVDVPANSTYVGDKTGNGENPNTDESQLLEDSTKTKVNVESYLENYDGTGYDKSTEKINVDKSITSYTYNPKDIMGFSFDSSNEGNTLTTTVNEDGSSVVKAYYKRNNYNIQYVLNDGQNNSSNPTSYRYGSSIKLGNATKQGFKFLGWYTDATYENEITEITVGTAGDLTLYAKYMDEANISSYTVEYYKQNEDKGGYTIVSEDTEKISGIIGEEVFAKEKNYDGYTLNENSIRTGVVQENGKLVLRMYYDLNKKSGEDVNRGAYVTDDGKINFVAKDNVSHVLVYYKVVSGESEAKAFYEQAIASNGRNCPGYFMEKEGDVFKKALEEKVTGDQYVIYRFNIADKEFTEWKLEKISDLGSSSDKKTATYKTSYYIQNSTGNGYTEDKTLYESETGNVGEGVIGKAKSIKGFTINMEKSIESGVVKEDGSLELKFYYDRNTYLINYYGLNGAINNNPSKYVYGNKVVLSNPTGNVEFQGWYLDPAYNEKVTEISENTEGNISLYAKFEKIGPSEPVTTKPSEPATTKPSEPVTTKPSEPVTTQNISGGDAESHGNYKNIEHVDKDILSQKNDKDYADSTFGKLRLKGRKIKKTSIKITWKKVSKTSKYIVYGAKCGTNYKKLKETDKLTFTDKKLKKGKYYKYVVVAIDDKNQVLAVSKMIHLATKGGKVGNCKKLKVSRKAINISRKKFKIKVKQVAENRKIKIRKHRKIGFESGNPSVAKVSANGWIQPVNKGKCTIYVYAQNGVYKQIKVTVK